MNKEVIYSQHYEVNPLTLAIVPEFSEAKDHGEPMARILEEDAEYIVNLPPSKIIDDACKFFGSSLRGRQEGTKEVCRITYKAPISIDPTSGMYFFPTASPNNPQCSWIAHSHVDFMQKNSVRQTKIIFKNGKSVIVDVSYGIMLNQIQRTAQFRYLLDQRIKMIQQQKFDMIAEPSP